MFLLFPKDIQREILFYLNEGDYPNVKSSVLEDGYDYFWKSKLTQEQLVKYKGEIYKDAYVFLTIYEKFVREDWSEETIDKFLTNEIFLGKHIDISSVTGITALMYLCRQKTLLDDKIDDFNEIRKYTSNVDEKLTKLYDTSSKYLKYISLLVEKGATIDKKEGTFGDTALMLAVNSTHGYATAKILVRAGANINVQNHCGHTVLHNTIAHGKVNSRTFKYLIKKGVNVNLKNSHGRTALHLLYYRRCPVEFVKILIKNGADVNIQDYNGMSALDCFRAEPKTYKDVLNMLENVSKC
jgi:ankyrin repeat protein